MTAKYGIETEKPIVTPEEKLRELGLTLPEASTPVANYVPYRWAGNLLYISGQGPKRPDGTYRVGRLGKNASVEDGYEELRTRIHANGEQAVSFQVVKQSGKNTVAVADGAKAKLAQIEKTFPAGISSSLIVDQSKFIRENIHVVVRLRLLCRFHQHGSRCQHNRYRNGNLTRRRRRCGTSGG